MKTFPILVSINYNYMLIASPAYYFYGIVITLWPIFIGDIFFMLVDNVKNKLFL